MALPTSATTKRAGSYAFSGIELGIFPSTDKTLNIELQSATANSTASSMWQSQIFPPTQNADFRFTYMAPFSTRTYYFRARHPAQPGYSAGAFTPTVSAKPTALGTIQRPIMPQMTYAGNVEIPSGSDVWLSSSKTVKVGTQATTGTITRRIRVDAALFQPTSNGQTYLQGGGQVRPGSTATLDLRANVTLPPGIQLTGMKVHFFKGTATDSCVWQFVAYPGSGGAGTALSSGSATSTGWTSSTQSFSHTVTTAFAYNCRIILNPNASALNARLGFVELAYQRGAYSYVY